MTGKFDELLLGTKENDSIQEKRHKRLKISCRVYEILTLMQLYRMQEGKSMTKNDILEELLEDAINTKYIKIKNKL